MQFRGVFFVALCFRVWSAGLSISFYPNAITVVVTRGCTGSHSVGRNKEGVIPRFICSSVKGRQAWDLPVFLSDVTHLQHPTCDSGHHPRQELMDLL